MSFEGKTALITGSGAVGGLGHATAKILAAGGARVIITGTDAQRGAEVVQDLLNDGGTARFVQADLSEVESIHRLADEAGAVDILVNNASLLPFSATADQDAESFDAATAVNVRAPFLLTAALAPKMAANGGGSIVNVSSTAAGIGMPGLALYGATKSAVESFTRATAAEFAPSNVRVNAVSPGPTRTAKFVAMLGPDGGGIAETTALKRTAEPSEVAEVIAFLAGDRASIVTGAVVAADGGRSAI